MKREMIIENSSLSEVEILCNNSEDEYDESCYELFTSYTKLLITVVVLTLFGIIILVGLVGNSLVVLVVSLNHQMRSPTNVLILNLAISDLLFIILCVPFTATDYALNYWPFGSPWCKIVQYLVIVTAYVSIYTLVLMSLDRFLAVVYAVASMTVRNVKNTCLAIALMWFVIIVTCVPILMAHGETTTDGVQVCRFLRQFYTYDAFQLSFFATAYVLPLLIVSVLYFIMLKKLWNISPAGHSSEESIRGKKRVTRMVVIVVVVFTVCWCPIHLVLVLRSIDTYPITPLSVMIQVVSQVLAYMNSCVNPILYAFLSDNFRKGFRKIICPHVISGHVSRYNNENVAKIILVKSH